MWIRENLAPSLLPTTQPYRKRPARALPFLCRVLRVVSLLHMSSLLTWGKVQIMIVQNGGICHNQRMLTRSWHGATWLLCFFFVSPGWGLESYEHIQLATQTGGTNPGCLLVGAHFYDLPMHQQPVSTWPAEWQERYRKGDSHQKRLLSCGLMFEEISALAGDLYVSCDALSVAPLLEIYELLPLLYRHTTTTDDFQRVTGGRYLYLARNNHTHFSDVNAPNSNNQNVWRVTHQDAISAAQQGDRNHAWVLEAFASHFLADAFSGGHSRVPRTEWMQTTQGNINSKVMHDLDNHYGVQVNNPRGDGPWVAYGDGDWNQPANTKNKLLAQEALRLAKQDIEEALTKGKQYILPKTFASLLIFPQALYLNDNKRWKPTSAEGVVLPVLKHLITPTGPAGPLGPVGYGAYVTSWVAHQLLPSQYKAVEETAAVLAVQELPSQIRGVTESDNDVRQWIGKYSPSVLARIPWKEKERLAKALLEGTVDYEDIQALQKLLGSVSSQEERAWLRSQLGPAFAGVASTSQRRLLRALLEKEVR